MRIGSVFITLVVALPLFLMGCSNEQEDAVEEPVVRGLKAYRVSQSASTVLRRYPSVVKPAQESKLSFEVGGKLKDIKLEVGQRIKAGDVLAEIDPVSLEIKVEKTKASLDEANASLRNVRLNYDRQKSLLKKNYVTQSEFDATSAQLKSLEAQVSQTRKQLDLAREDLSKAKLISPFEGIISSIEAQDYAQVVAGEVILGIYSENSYEIAFSVPAAIINSLNVGDKVNINFIDLPGQTHNGRIKELGSRAGQVSAFPVVVSIDQPPSKLRAGMAADVEIDIALASNDEGYLVPISSFYFDGAAASFLREKNQGAADYGIVFVYDEKTETVSTRNITMSGLRGNKVIVKEGLNEGDIIAAAGVSYLYDGQRVKLLPLE